jgi:NADH-quinone oxidoreductase subunit B
MSRPVSYNVNEKKLETDISVAGMPEGHQGEGFFATSFNKVVGLARKNSIWPLPFATSCCGIEFMATMGSHYDLARFGSERVGFSPRQCDLLMVMGTIAKKNGTCRKAGLFANGRTTVGDSCWSMCFFRWDF